MNRRLVYAAMIVILIAAFLLRVPRLDMVPPGLFYDEASDGLDVLRIVRGGDLPIFFEGNAGREPLFNYAQVVAVQFLGLSILSLRLVAAFAGILTIPVAFVLGRRLSAGLGMPTLVGLLCAAGVATSFWHVDFSRLGQRAILLPLFAGLSIYFFSRARQTEKMRDWVAAGVFLGISQYTYLAARFFPFVFVIFFSGELLVQRRQFRVWSHLVMFLAALAIFAPFGLYYLSEPGAFLGRAQDVALDGIRDLVTNAGRVSDMFLVRGDVEWRHNLAGRPALDWIAFLPFLAGILGSFFRWKQSATWLVWLCLVLMLLPTLLSQGAPDFARAIGALVPVCVITAWGWDALVQTVARRAPRLAPVAAGAALGLALIGSGFITAQDYFVRWANDKHTYTDFEGGTTDFAEWVARSSEPVYLPLELYAHPTVRLLTSTRFPVLTSATKLAAQMPEAGWIVPISADTSRAYVLLKGNQALLLEPVIPPSLKPSGSVDGRFGPVTPLARTTGAAFQIGQAPPITLIGAEFSDGLTLVGYRTEGAQEGLNVVLYWRMQHPVKRDPRLFIHWIDSEQDVIGRTDGPLTCGLSVLDWPIGEIIPDQHFIKIDGLPPQSGDALEVGLSAPFNGDRYDVTLPDGTMNDFVRIEPVHVSSPASK